MENATNKVEPLLFYLKMCVVLVEQIWIYINYPNFATNMFDCLIVGLLLGPEIWFQCLL